MIDRTYDPQAVVDQLRAEAQATSARLAGQALRRRLAWSHGAMHAELILSGRDPATERDVAAWDRLGAPER